MPVYKSKDGKSYYAYFYYTDWAGTLKRKKKTGFSKKKDAQNYEKNFCNSMEATTDITFNNLVNAYMDDCKIRLKATTCQTKENIISTKLLPYFGKTPIKDITTLMVRKWQNEMLSSTQNYAQTYLKSVNSQLSAIFNYSVKYYGLTKNPVALTESIGRKESGRLDFWTLQEFNKFYEIAKEDPTDKLLFLLLFFSGMRLGELLALSQRKFAFTTNNVFGVKIDKTYVRLKGVDYLQYPKTDSSIRFVALPKFLISEIEYYISLIYGYEPNDRIFPFTPHNVRSRFYRLIEKTGLKKIRVHDLRHSHASLLINLGYTTKLISERLGHKNEIETTKIYIHLYPNKHSNAVADLDALNPNQNTISAQDFPNLSEQIFTEQSKLFAVLNSFKAV